MFQEHKLEKKKKKKKKIEQRCSVTQKRIGEWKGRKIRLVSEVIDLQRVSFHIDRAACDFSNSVVIKIAKRRRQTQARKWNRAKKK